MYSLRDMVRNGVLKIEMRDWNKAVGFDQAYLSHHHTVEVCEDLLKELGFRATVIKTVRDGEYRTALVEPRHGTQLFVTTTVNVDSSTYTYLHINGHLSIESVEPFGKIRLSGADIRSSIDRNRRRGEIHAGLVKLKFLLADPKKEAPKKKRGPVVRIEADGTRVLDYTFMNSMGYEDETETLSAGVQA